MLVCAENMHNNFMQDAFSPCQKVAASKTHCSEEDFIAMTESIVYVDYTDESMLPDIQRLVTKDLSEPYSVFTYRYFLHNSPRFCICAYSEKDNDPSTRVMISTIVCKLEGEGDAMQGYMAMLAVDQDYRKRGIAQKLVTMVIDRMAEDGCKEVMLETEVLLTALSTPCNIIFNLTSSISMQASNLGAQALYAKMGFVKEEKMVKYYLNGGDAYRLKLWIDKDIKSETTTSV